MFSQILENCIRYFTSDCGGRCCKDVDCKGDRICENRMCVNPSEYQMNKICRKYELDFALHYTTVHIVILFIEKIQREFIFYKTLFYNFISLTKPETTLPLSANIGKEICLQSFIFNNQKFVVLIALMSYRLFHLVSSMSDV